MNKDRKAKQIVRWILGVILVVAGLSTTWAWGEVARLAGPPPATEPKMAALYGAWQPAGAEQSVLFRSLDEGQTWQPLPLPVGSAPVVWADDGKKRVAVATEDGSLLRSVDRGDSWVVEAPNLPISSLVWGGDGSLYLGTDGQGVHRLLSDGTLVNLGMDTAELASARVVGLSLAEGRLYAATPTVLFYAEPVGRSATGPMLAEEPLGGVAWSKTALVPDWVTAVAATDAHTVYAGTATTGVYRSTDAGQTWEPAWDGLGLAAGQMVKVTALRADLQETDLLYVAVDHLVGSTHVEASAAGSFATLDGGSFWQPLAGPTFPEAKQAQALVVVPGKPLAVQAVTAAGLQGYALDAMRALAGLESSDPRVRAASARQLGLARSQGVWNELLAALDDPEPAVSMAAADALGRINDPAAAGGLLVAIEHPREQVRAGAARALGMMGVEAAVEPLRAMLLQGEALEVSTAAEALGRIGGQAATDALTTALSDPEPTARWHLAMAALEGMGEPAVAPLVMMLDSQNLYARRNAAQALGWIGSPSATEALVRALKKDGDATVREEAAWALGGIKDPAARKALERAQLRDPEARVQVAAEWALSRVPVESGASAGWASRWAPAFNQFQPVRWLVLVLSLAAAAWIVAGSQRMATVPVGRRTKFRS